MNSKAKRSSRQSRANSDAPLDLKDFGFTAKQIREMQRIQSLPENAVEVYFKRCNERDLDFTTEGMLRFFGK
jgi:hypothetical protein